MTSYDVWPLVFYLGMCLYLKIHKSEPSQESKVGVWVIGMARSGRDPLTAVYEGVYTDNEGKEFRYPFDTPAADIPAHLEKFVITVSTDEIRVLGVKLSSDGTIMPEDREAIRKEFNIV